MLTPLPIPYPELCGRGRRFLLVKICNVGGGLSNAPLAHMNQFSEFKLKSVARHQILPWLGNNGSLVEIPKTNITDNDPILYRDTYTWDDFNNTLTQPKFFDAVRLRARGSSVNERRAFIVFYQIERLTPFTSLIN